MAKMNGNALSGGFMDQADKKGKGQKKAGAAPFATSWTNSRPLASTKSLQGAPGGVLSPKKLAGVGRGK